MESLADDLTQMRRTPLSADHVEAIREIATIKSYSPGQYVLPAGENLDRFIYVLDGEVEAVDPYTEERLMKGTIGPTQFVGDITFLSGTKVTLPMRAVQATQTLEVPRAEMLQLMARVPEMSDIIISVMAARRRMQLEVHASSLKIIGADHDPSLQKVVAFADRNKIPYVTEEIGDKYRPGSGFRCRAAASGTGRDLWKGPGRRRPYTTQDSGLAGAGPRRDQRGCI